MLVDTSNTTTTTTLGTVEIAENQSNTSYGLIPSIGIDSNDLTSVFKVVNNNAMVCGTLLQQCPKWTQLFLKRESSENTVLPSTYSQSSNTAKIFEQYKRHFCCRNLNGDSKFNFILFHPLAIKQLYLNHKQLKFLLAKQLPPLVKMD